MTTVPTLVNGDLITQTYVQTISNSGMGMIGRGIKTTSQTGITTVTDLTGLSVTFTATSGRWYKVSAQCELGSTVAGDLLVLYLADAANTPLARDVVTAPPLTSGNAYTKGTILYMYNGFSGSVTFKLRLERNVGTGTASNSATATYPSFIVVEDLGV